MMIAYIMVPHFAAAVERRDNPKLRRVPLIILKPRGRERVYALSQEAAEVGVREGMPLSQAEALCPEAVFIPASPSRYRQAAEEFLGVLELFGPVEPDEEGRAYLDLGKLGEGRAVEIAQRLGRAIRREARLAAAMGVAGGKLSARLAACCVGPNQALILSPGSEGEFLRTFPVEVLPAGGEMARHLRFLGILTLGQLAALPPGAVLARFGKEGRRLQRLALGLDDGRVVPRRKPPEEASWWDFDGPVYDLGLLEGIGQEMVRDLAVRLRDGGAMCRELRVCFRFEDGSEWEESLAFSEPTSSRGRIASGVGRLLRQVKYPCGVVGLGVILGGIVPQVGKQLDLFAGGVGGRARLRRVVNELIQRCGPGLFWQARLVDGECLPERRFVLVELGDDQVVGRRATHRRS